jgi:phosphoglycolate phosphatase-like HAD superfamily hydrolase
MNLEKIFPGMLRRFMPSVKSDLAQYIFFDLDGTLLDNSERLYACYCDILKAQNSTNLGKEAYMTMKRDKSPISHILQQSGSREEAHVFHDKWMTLIETAPYLARDVLKPGALQGLQAARSYGKKIILITKRHNRDALFNQLKDLHIFDCFDEIITPTTKKSEALRALNPVSAVVIGDTEEDADAAQAIGATFVGITTGLRTAELLPAKLSYEQVVDINWPDVMKVMNDSVP